jgi:hypothetical protein
MMTPKSRLISIVAVFMLITFAALAVFPDLAAILSPSVSEVLAKPSVAGAVVAISAIAPQPLAYSIKEFCREHGISPPFYYDLKRQGLGPAEMRMGNIVRISHEAAAAWRKARENPSESEAEASSQIAKALRDRARRAARRAIQSPNHVSRRFRRRSGNPDR